MTHIYIKPSSNQCSTTSREASAAGRLRPNAVIGCAVKRRWSTAGITRPGTGSLHPVAIRAVVEATRLLKPLVQRVAKATWRACRP